MQHSEEMGNDTLRVGAAWSIGWRPEMEDAHAVHLDLGGQAGRALFAGQWAVDGGWGGVHVWVGRTREQTET